MKKENHLFMGAKNTRTKQLENPRYASKANNYSCPRCESDVKLRQGEVYEHHFAHKNENKVGGCKYYKKGGATESEKHKLGKHKSAKAKDGRFVPSNFITYSTRHVVTVVSRSAFAVHICI